jgi:hypothetical protein
MRCKDIERLIIDSSDEKLSSEELKGIEQHVADCAQCARFKDELEKIQVCIKEMPLPVPTPDLVQKTRKSCYAEMSEQSAKNTGITPQLPIHPLPKLMWAALFSLILLTVLFFAPAFKEILEQQSLSFSSAVVLTLIIQNAVMLVLTPVLLRKYRWKQHNLEVNSLDVKAS